MLVLSRKNQERVVVAESVESDPLLTVTVLAIKGNSVKLGFEARHDLLVNRWEVWEKMSEEVASSVHLQCYTS